MIYALLDANVLYSAPIRDLLLNMAENDLFKPLWSVEIQEEWKRNLLKNRPDLDPKLIDRTSNKMNQAFPDALIEGYEHRINLLSLRDPDDRHVLAAAIEAKANYLVTANLKDFQGPSLKTVGVQVIHPDEFLSKLISENSDTAYQSFERLVANLKSPSQSKSQVLSSYTNCGLLETVKILAEIGNTSD